MEQTHREANGGEHCQGHNGDDASAPSSSILHVVLILTRPLSSFCFYLPYPCLAALLVPELVTPCDPNDYDVVSSTEREKFVLVTTF